MKKAVMFGAGNIGRGFIGKVFSESEYEVVFIDIVSKIVDAINTDKEYPVRIVSNEFTEEVTVRNIRAIDGNNAEKVSDVIAGANIMATAVGVNVLPTIVKPLCEGLKKRFKENNNYLNILICENLIDSHLYLRELIEAEIGLEYKEILSERVGLVEASIGRMVPLMTDEMKESNILRVWVEPFEELPVDKDGFKGGIPQIKGMVPFSPFSFYIKRKLFIHNLGHAICAYLGWGKGYEYIYECCEDKDIADKVEKAMKESARALSREYCVPPAELNAHITDLLLRFKNRALGDTVVRVGKDPIRKLGINDRLVGAAVYCIEQGIEPEYIAKGITAALRYDNKEDASATQLNAFIRNKGIDKCIREVCCIVKGSLLYEKIISNYEKEIL